MTELQLKYKKTTSWRISAWNIECGSLSRHSCKNNPLEESIAEIYSAAHCAATHISMTRNWLLWHLRFVPEMLKHNGKTHYDGSILAQLRGKLLDIWRWMIIISGPWHCCTWYAFWSLSLWNFRNVSVDKAVNHQWCLLPWLIPRKVSKLAVADAASATRLVSGWKEATSIASAKSTCTAAKQDPNAAGGWKKCQATNGVIWEEAAQWAALQFEHEIFLNATIMENIIDRLAAQWAALPAEHQESNNPYISICIYMEACAFASVRF